VDWKPERAVQLKVMDSKIKIKSNGCWNTLMEEYTASVQKWRLLPRFLGQEWTFSPRKHQLLLCTELTISNGLTKPSRMSSSMKIAECCTVKPLPSPSFLFCFVPSSHLSHTIYMIVQVAFIHSCIHASTHQYFCEFTHSCVHNAHAYTTSSHTWLRQSPIVSSNKRTTRTLSKVSSLVDLVKRCHWSCLKWQVPTNEQLKLFQKCHPQWVWFRDVTNQMSSYQFQPTKNLYLPHIKWRVLTNEHFAFSKF